MFGGDGTTTNPGLKPVLDKIRTLLDKLDTIAAAEDLDALKAMSGEVDTLNQIATDLNAILVAIKGDGTLANLGIVPRVVDLIGAHAQPAMVRPRVGGGVGFPPRFWTVRDFLSKRRTGKFARQLWDSAQTSGDDRFRAYALGWLSSWSLSAGGASAVASIVGARTATSGGAPASSATTSTCGATGMPRSARGPSRTPTGPICARRNCTRPWSCPAPASTRCR